MSNEDLKDELERLRKENEALKKGASSNIRMKVSEKGAVSIYGMGRFPVTWYKEQWLKLLDMSTAIRAFIAANEAQLKKKGFIVRSCGCFSLIISRLTAAVAVGMWATLFRCPSCPQ